MTLSQMKPGVKVRLCFDLRAWGKTQPDRPYANPLLGPIIPKGTSGVIVEALQGEYFAIEVEHEGKTWQLPRSPGQLMKYRGPYRPSYIPRGK